MDSLIALEEVLQQKIDDGLISEQDALDELYGSQYEEAMPKLFSLIVDAGKTFKPNTLAEAMELRKLFEEGVENYKISQTNKVGEFHEGVTIYDSMEIMIRDFPNIPELQGDIVARQLHEIGKAFEPSPKTYDRFIKECAHAFRLQMNNQLKVLDPALVELPTLEILKKFTPLQKAAPSLGLSFQALFDEFMAFKEPDLRPNQASLYRTYFPVLLHFIGNKSVSEIDRSNVKRCLQSCMKFPKRNLGQYKGKSVQELAAMDIPEKDRLADRTVADYKKLLQGIFAYAREQGYISVSPANDLNLDIQFRKKKAAFKASEVVLLLQNALNGKDEWKKWFILLLAYTGARRGEIAQLRREDFKADSESGLEYILITDEEGQLKTGNALRQVPLHSKLIELGLHSFLASGSGALFTHPNADAAMSRYVTAQMGVLGIPKFDDFQHSRTLHSLRHSFITETRGSGFSLDLIQTIVGHEKTSGGQTDVYTSPYSINKLLPVVESIKYL